MAGRQRPLLTATLGRALAAGVGPAAAAAAAGGWAVLGEADAGALLERLARLWVDGGDRGEFADGVSAAYGIAVEAVTRPPGQRGCVVQPRRWAVERSCGWLKRGRRLAKDCEAGGETSVAWLDAAFCRLLLRRLAHAQ